MTYRALRCLKQISLPAGGTVEIELRGLPARHRELWVVLHGLGGDRKAPLASCLKRRLREKGVALIMPDLPGHGASGSDPTALSVVSGMEVLDYIYREWGCLAGGFCLAGFSYGGLIAAWWAARNPEKVKELVLGAPAFCFAERLREVVGPEQFATARAEGRLEFIGPQGPIIVGGATLAEEEEFATKLLAKQLKNPTLIIHGLEDEALPWRASLDFVATCHGPVELCLLPGATHNFAGLEESFCHRVDAFRAGHLLQHQDGHPAN